MNQELYQLTVGAVLKWSRLQKDITLAKASELSGLSLQYIGELERGEKNPSESSIDSLCKAYEIKFDRSYSTEELGLELMNEFIHKLNFLSLNNIDNSYFFDDSKFSLSFLYKQLLNEAYYLVIKNNSYNFSYFLKTLGKYYDQTGGLLYSLYNFLLSIYYDSFNDDKCLEYAEKSLSNSGNAEAFFRANYSAMLCKYNCLIHSLIESEKSIFIAQNHSYFKLIQLTKMNQGIIYIKLRQYNEAIQILGECLETARDNNIDDIVMKCKENIVYAYLLDNKLSDAIEYCDKYLKQNNYTFQIVHMIDCYYKNKSFSCNNKQIDDLYADLIDIRKNLTVNTINKCIKKYNVDFVSFQLILNSVIHNLEKKGDYKLANVYLKQLYNFTNF